MEKISFFSKKKLISFFNALSSILRPGDVVFLYGDLGVGKTFSTGVMINYHVNDIIVPSPTFNIVNTYQINNHLEILHCDFFRLHEQNELEEIGIFENLDRKIIIIEWPKYENLYNFEPLKIFFEYGEKKNNRNVIFDMSNNWKKRTQEIFK